MTDRTPPNPPAPAAPATRLPPLNPPFAEPDPQRTGEQRTVLVIGAHPDDPDFSSAGTAALWVAVGLRVVYIVVTSGDKGTPDHTMTHERLITLREAEQIAAAAESGVKDVVFLRFRDGELMPNMDLRGAITREIRRWKPYAVLVHDPTTVFYNNAFINHPDHRAVGFATVDAIYPTARDPLQFHSQIVEEGLEPHKVKEIYLFGTDSPTGLVDISSTIETKIAALRHHVTQIGEADAMAERIRTRAAETGALGGVPYAEAFRRIVMRS
jgi:LmbE family N-acetylglucosaminyl deacetylase